MSDLGYEYPTGSPIEAPSETPQKQYPCLHNLTSEQLPDLALYDVGEEITLTVTGIVKRKELTEADGQPKRESIDIELHDGEVQTSGAHKTMKETGMTKAQAEAH